MSDTIDRPIADDPLAEHFFSQPPPPIETGSEAWEPRPMSVGQHRAMRATLAMLLFVAAVTACFAAYAEIAMVKPARIGNAALPHVLAQPLAEPVPAAPPEVVALEPANQPAPTATPEVEREPAQQQPSATPDPLLQAAAEPEPAAAQAPESAPQRETTVARVPGPKPGPAAGSAAARDPETAARVDALTKQAYRELRGGQALQASDLASRAIRLDPTRASAYIALGGARDALGDRAGARSAFRDCMGRAADSLVSACRTLAR